LGAEDVAPCARSRSFGRSALEPRPTATYERLTPPHCYLDFNLILAIQYAFTLLLPESDPYHPWEKRFLSDPGCMPRYCRAAKWKMDNAKERIRGTIEWRREFKPDLIKPDHVKIVSIPFYVSVWIHLRM
jgi:hypothetical protein